MSGKSRFICMLTNRHPTVQTGPQPRLLKAFYHKKKRTAILSKLPFFYGGGCRIRTRVDFRPNGFQDRPVMTASVTLRIYTCQIFRPCFVYGRLCDPPYMDLSGKTGRASSTPGLCDLPFPDLSERAAALCPAAASRRAAAPRRLDYTRYLPRMQASPSHFTPGHFP